MHGFGGQESESAECVFFSYCIFMMIAELKKNSLILKMNDDSVKLKESLSTMQIEAIGDCVCVCVFVIVSMPVR